MTGKKIWHAVEIAALREADDALQFAFDALGALGTEVSDLDKKKGDDFTIVGYFDEKPNAENIEFQISNALEIYALSADVIKNVEWREIEDRDWLIEWKKYWRPTETEKFIVAPAWEKIDATEKIVIRIEPGMAFGTGTHETTRLCLKAIGENYRSDMSFLDIGTGTGILAIAAAKIQAESKKEKGKIFACDIDEDSIKIARENAEVNGVSEGIEFYVAAISEKTPAFDFVCANLTADVIVSLLPLLIRKTKRVLVLSGILKEQEDSIVSELKKLNVEDLKIETDGEWISIKVCGWR